MESSDYHPTCTVVASRLAGLVDVMPTTLDLLEIDRDLDLRGRSVRSVWSGQAWEPIEYVGEANQDRSGMTLCTDTHKCVVRGDGSRRFAS